MNAISIKCKNASFLRKYQLTKKFLNKENHALFIEQSDISHIIFLRTVFVDFEKHKTVTIKLKHHKLHLLYKTVSRFLEFH